jgi:hypothetical protein
MLLLQIRQKLPLRPSTPQIIQTYGCDIVSGHTCSISSPMGATNSQVGDGHPSLSRSPPLALHLDMADPAGYSGDIGYAVRGGSLTQGTP